MRIPRCHRTYKSWILDSSDPCWALRGRSLLASEAPYLRQSLLRVRQLSTNTGTEHLPRIAQPSIWQSIIPKALRNRDKPSSPSERKPTNPASYFIWIYLFIGSQAIRIIGVQNEFNTYMRRAEQKIATLREVIEKLQKGEPVDVEKALGTGDKKQELEWEEALKEIIDEDKIWQENQQKIREAKEKAAAEAQEASPVNNSLEKASAPVVEQSADGAAVRPPPGFY